MFQLDQVVPRGRDLSEYSEMFDIADDEWPRRVLGCGDGPASFNAELQAQGRVIRSSDPLYLYSRNQIGRRLDTVRPEVLQQLTDNRDEFVWTRFRDVDHLEEIRLRAMAQFLADYETGRQQGRYVAAALPHLPFRTGAFELAVCSHFLFLYSEQFGFEFHYQATRELLRCAHEVRIFPVLQLGARESSHLKPLMAVPEENGFSSELLESTYQFLRGGNRSLRIFRQA